MKPRERVLVALSHREPDRIPIDFGATRMSGIHVLAYSRLREYLGLPAKRPPRVFDVYQMLAEIEPEVASRFAVDCRGIFRLKVAFDIPNDRWKLWVYPGNGEVEVPADFSPMEDENGLVLVRDGRQVARKPSRGYYFERTEKFPGALHPDLEGWEPPRVDKKELEYMSAVAKRLREETPFATVMQFGPPFELFYGLGTGDFHRWMITFAREPHYVERLYKKIVDAWIENLEEIAGYVRSFVDVIVFGDDFGTQERPFLSVSAFRRLVMPAYKRGIDWIHANTEWRVMLHSDGALVPLLPSIVEMGVDILNPVQVGAKGMVPELLKREFGDRLVFWGGSCDAVTLSLGTPEQVRIATKRNIKAFAPNGGYVFSPIHNIQPDVRPENIVALFDTALEFVYS